MNQTTFVRRLAAVGLLLLAASAVAQKPAKLLFDGKTWWDHVKVVADDSMEGRETGSLGLRKAEAYAVEQMKRAGLEPAGTDGFYQSVQFVQRQIDEPNSYAFLTRNGQSNPVALGDDAYFSTRVEGSDGEVNAPLVFAGNGLQVPESHVDDLAGLDLKGKVVVYLAGSPSSVPGALAAHYGALAQRWKSYAAAGAVGTIVIPNPASMDIPWSRMSLNRAHPTMDLAAPEWKRVIPFARAPRPDRTMSPSSFVVVSWLQLASGFLGGAMRKTHVVFICSFLALLMFAMPGRSSGQSALPKPDKDTVLKAADIKPKLFPETVFFRGQSAPVQMRNTGGVHFADDLYVLAGMVDNSGYSSGIREKYQAYLITEVALRIGEQTLKPGAYGVGFVEGGKFLVLDLAANDLAQATSQRDAEIKRPVPLQIVAAGEPGKYRLYMGRDYVEFSRTK